VTVWGGSWGILLALAPLALFLLLFWSRRCRGATRHDLLRAFVAGLVATVPVAALLAPGGVMHAATPLAEALLAAFIQAALPEESVKLLVMLWLCRQVASGRAAVTSGVAFGLGFAFVENLIYAAHGGWVASLIRLVSAVPCHAFLGAVMAYYVARALAQPSPAALIKAWLVPLLLHGLYDLPLMIAVDGLRASAQAALLTGLVLALLATWTRFLLTRLARPVT